MLVEVEEIELRPEPAVIAPLRLLDALEVRVEIGLRVEGRPVDPRQLRVLLVAAPVGAGEAGQLDRLDRPRVLEMRAAAEVGEVALRVEGDRPLGRADQLDLVRLAFLPRSGGGLPRRKPPRASTAGPRRARAGSPPRSSGDPPRGSARGTRSRSRSRSRSAARSRPSRRDTTGGRPRRADARTSAGGRRARRDPTCRAWSGSGSAARPRAAAAGPGRARSSARARPVPQASGRSRARRRAPWRLSGSSSSVWSGRTTFMTNQDKERATRPSYMEMPYE